MTFVQFRNPATMIITAMTLAISPAVAQEQVAPSTANPSVRQFDSPNLIYAGLGDRGAPLAVILPGTGGTSDEAPRLLLQTIRQQGYRVIYLSYDDTPAAD